MTLTDHLTFGLLLLGFVVFLFLIFLYKDTFKKHIQDIFKALLLAFLALILRYLSLTLLVAIIKQQFLMTYYLQYLQVPSHQPHYHI